MKGSEKQISKKFNLTLFETEGKKKEQTIKQLKVVILFLEG